MSSAPPVQPVLVSAYEQFRASKARGTDPSAGMHFDPAGSPLHGQAVFVVGAPRSGTTWLQQLLALHPDVATAGEMHVICEGVATLFANHEGNDPYSGLSGWVTRPELATLARALIDGIMVRLRDTSRPTATRVLDKTPDHVPYAALLAELYPDASFVHIIRDGRAAAASAQRLWSWNEGYREHGRTAARWRDAVLDCRRHLSGLRYVEVRYEDLVRDTAGQLRRVLAAVGLPFDEDFLGEVVRFGSIPVNVSPSARPPSAEPPELPATVEREMLRAAGDLLVELGYVDEQRSARLLAERSWRDAAAGTGAVARRGVQGLRRRLAGRIDATERQRRRRWQVRSVARRCADGLAAGVPEQVVATLAPDAQVTDGQVDLRGAAEVARYLLERTAGTREVSLDADEQAALVRWAGDDGQQLHRLHLSSDGRIARVSIEAPSQGRAQPAADPPSPAP